MRLKELEEQIKDLVFESDDYIYSREYQVKKGDYKTLYVPEYWLYDEVYDKDREIHEGDFIDITIRLGNSHTSYRDLNFIFEIEESVNKNFEINEIYQSLFKYMKSEIVEVKKLENRISNPTLYNINQLYNLDNRGVIYKTGKPENLLLYDKDIDFVDIFKDIYGYLELRNTRLIIRVSTTYSSLRNESDYITDNITYSVSEKDFDMKLCELIDRELRRRNRRGELKPEYLEVRVLDWFIEREK